MNPSQAVEEFENLKKEIEILKIENISSSSMLEMERNAYENTEKESEGKGVLYHKEAEGKETMISEGKDQIREMDREEEKVVRMSAEDQNMEVDEPRDNEPERKRQEEEKALAGESGPNEAELSLQRMSDVIPLYLFFKIFNV
jgi:hypothetical protein